MNREKLYRLRYYVPVAKQLNSNGRIEKVRDFMRLESVEKAIAEYRAKGWGVIDLTEYELVRRRTV